jgi:hypothetical protein
VAVLTMTGSTVAYELLLPGIGGLSMSMENRSAQQRRKREDFQGNFQIGHACKEPLVARLSGKFNVVEVIPKLPRFSGPPRAYKLPRVSFPNAYSGATAQFAHFTQFSASGLPIGGFGTENQVTPTSHSSYNALQLSATGETGHGGPGLQASYTWSKSLDDTSTVAGTSATSSVSAIVQAAPQNPFDTHPERGPSTFDAPIPSR